MGKRHRNRFSVLGVSFSKIIDSLDYSFLIGENPDFVIIASPAITHYNYVKICLERHIPVFVEKPLATTREDALELMQLAKTNETLLFVAQSEYFNPIFLNFRSHFSRELKIARSKQPLNVYLDFRREHQYSERCQDVNVALDLLIHDVCLFLTMFSYDSICNIQGKLLNNGDEALLQIETIENNIKVYATFYVNRNSKMDVRELSAKFADAKYTISLSKQKGNGDVIHASDSLDNEHKFFMKLLAGACGTWGNRFLKTAVDAVTLVCKCH